MDGCQASSWVKIRGISVHPLSFCLRGSDGLPRRQRPGPRPSGPCVLPTLALSPEVVNRRTGGFKDKGELPLTSCVDTSLSLWAPLSLLINEGTGLDQEFH